VDWLEPFLRRAMNRKAKRWGNAKASAHDEGTIFLDYLSDRLMVRLSLLVVGGC
jgi:hypothetical protein